MVRVDFTIQRIYNFSFFYYFFNKYFEGTIHIPGQNPIKFSHQPEMDWKMSRLLNKEDLTDQGSMRRQEEAIFNLFEAGQYPQFNDELVI